MMMTNLRANRTGRSVFGLALAAAIASGPVASAQSKLVDPNTLPDLGVSVIAPSTVPAYDMSYVTVKIDSQGPLSGYYTRSGANSVWAIIDFTRLTPVYVWADSGLACSIANRGTAWNAVDCSGSLPFGSTATVYVWFTPMSQEFYCGTPTYVDGSLPTAGGDRNGANNRSIARVDMVGCIN